MQRVKSDLFKVNGKPLLLPDEEVAVSYEDLDDSDSGRDESGTMHRIVLRYKMGTWSWEFAWITEEEKQYMESCFPDEPEFEFTHPGREDASVPVTEYYYRSKYSISWKNAKTGMWRNYKFNLIQC